MASHCCLHGRAWGHGQIGRAEVDGLVQVCKAELDGVMLLLSYVSMAWVMHGRFLGLLGPIGQ